MKRATMSGPPRPDSCNPLSDIPGTIQFFEGEPYTLPHFLAGFSVTLVFIVVGGLLLVLGAWRSAAATQRTVALTAGLHQRDATGVREGGKRSPRWAGEYRPFGSVYKHTDCPHLGE